MKHLLIHASILTVTLLAQAAAAADARPNVIIIFTDDHGYADLSCQGIVDDVRTPHIDALAAAGVRMTSGYVTAPQCVPSRAGLLTGRYQNRFGVESNGEPLTGFDAELTLAERLQKLGYATGMSGKWHLGPPDEITRHGFSDVYCNQGGPQQLWSNFDLQGNSVPPATRSDRTYHLDANSAAACAFIRRHHEKPFFFYCAYRAPHVPLDPPEHYLKRFPGEMPERRRKALAMISAIDDGVGAIVKTLRDLKLEERTLIFLLGDNGAPLKIHKLDAPGGGPGWDGSLNDPLNGEKGMLTEGGIRVPWIVSWKGTIPPGRVYHHPVLSLDIAATSLAMAGVPDRSSLDGINLIPFLQGDFETGPKRALFWRWVGQAAIREGQWKYLRGGQREYLFNVEADREEQTNLIAVHPEIAAALREQLNRWGGELQPAGLATRPMASTWERYFDFYLDGKPAPVVSKSAAAASSVDGWVSRNAQSRLVSRALRVLPDPDSRQLPFLAASGLQIPGPAKVKVVVKVTQAGKIGIAWRLNGQKDFTGKQLVSVDVLPTNDFQQLELPVSSTDRIIHIRLLLPGGSTEIRHIAIRDAESRIMRQWKFDDKED